MLGNTRRAEHLKEEDSAPPATQTPATYTPVSSLNEADVFQRTDVSDVFSPTNKAPAASFRSKVSGRLWAIPRNRTEEQTTCSV